MFKTCPQVPIMVVMKAMGMECDQEVVQMVGRDPQYSALLIPSIEVTTWLRIKLHHNFFIFWP